MINTDEPSKLDIAGILGCVVVLAICVYGLLRFWEQ